MKVNTPMTKTQKKDNKRYTRTAAYQLIRQRCLTAETQATTDRKALVVTEDKLIALQERFEAKKDDVDLLTEECKSRDIHITELKQQLEKTIADFTESEANDLVE